MPDRVRSQKQAQRRRAEALRAAGKTWGEIATVFRDEYGVNARVALRLAHGWSQGDAADRWNERWPDDLKTFKNISYWERWPAASGYTPSLDVLTKLAQLYECHVAELLSDGADNRSSDPVYRARRDLQRLPAVIAHASTDGASAEVGGGAHPTLDDLVAHLDQADVQDLARETVLWSAQLDPSIDRRTLLLKLGFALTVAAAAPGRRGRSCGRRAGSRRRDGQPVRHLAQRVRLLQHRAGRRVHRRALCRGPPAGQQPLDREPPAVERVRGDDASHPSTG